MIASFWRAYHPPRTDVAIAGAFLLLGQLITWGQLETPEAFSGPRLSNAILNALLMAAIAWRRRAPLAALCWAATIYYLPLAVVEHDVTFAAAFVPLIVLTASAGYYLPRRRAAVAAALAMTCLLVVSLTTPELRSPDAIVVNTVFLLAPWLGTRGLREREERAAALAAALATERAQQAAALRAAAGAERAHIARELHDIVAHSVSMMVIQVGAARMQLQTDAAAATAPLLEAEEIGRQTLDDLRRLLGVLRTQEEVGASEQHDVGPDAAVVAEPPQPGLAQLDQLLEPVRAAGLHVAVQVNGDPVPLPAVPDLTAYRVVQEALTNALKHARARRAEVRLTYDTSALTVEVIDEGRTGHDRPRPVVEGAAQGLLGIRERVSMLGGRMSAGPTRGGGWRVTAEIPLQAAAVPEMRAAALPVS